MGTFYRVSPRSTSRNQASVALGASYYRRQTGLSASRAQRGQKGGGSFSAADGHDMSLGTEINRVLRDGGAGHANFLHLVRCQHGELVAGLHDKYGPLL